MDAAALTVLPVSEIPVLSLQTFAGIKIVGEIGRTYSIQFATDADSGNDWFNWASIANIVLPTTPYVFVDTASGARSKGFYRAVLLP